jgi:hypothetical protein
MSGRSPRDRALLTAAALVLTWLVACPQGAVAQRVFLYAEPTICSTPFKPIGGITFHAGSQWRVVWTTSPGQYGTATFVGSPNPVHSEGGKKIWEDPTAYVTCWIAWYLEGTQRQAYYDWHIEDYGGTVRDCSPNDPRQVTSDPNSTNYDAYESFDPYEPGGDCSDDAGGTGGTGGNSTGCPMEYVYVEISYDDGATWIVLWEGWAEVCG